MAADGKMQEHDQATLTYLRKLYLTSAGIQNEANTLVDWGDSGRMIAYDLLSTAFDVKVNAILGILHTQARMQGTSLDDPPVGIAIVQAIKGKSENERGASRIRDAYITMQSAMVGLDNLYNLDWVVKATAETTSSPSSPSSKRKTPDPPTGEAADDDAAAEEPPHNKPAVDPEAPTGEASDDGDDDGGAALIPDPVPPLVPPPSRMSFSTGR